MEPELRYEREGRQYKITLVEDGQVIGKTDVRDCVIRIAGEWVRMGGIGNVVLDRAQRGKGYSARLLHAALDYMRQERYPISILFGIPNFYDRFGFVPVLQDYEVSVATRDLEKLASQATVRPEREGERGVLLQLYHRVNVQRNGSQQRTGSDFDLHPDASWWVQPRRILVAEYQGAPRGYLMLGSNPGNPTQLQAYEIIVPSEHVATAGAALLAFLGQEALTRRLERVSFPMPPDEPVVSLLRGIGCKVEVDFPANRRGMGRIIDLAALAAAITPGVALRARWLPAN